jgi:hypothetical protein
MKPANIVIKITERPLESAVDDLEMKSGTERYRPFPCGICYLWSGNNALDR